MREIEIERLLQWAYRDELPKRGIGDVANDWARVSRYGELLSVIDDDPGFPVIMGSPHPDALTIERAVQGLHAEMHLDWSEYRYVLMGDMPMLAPFDDPFVLRKTARDKGRAALKGERMATVDRGVSDQATRMVFSEVSLVEQCAKLGRRPVWDIGRPKARRIIAPNGRVALVGESKGDGRYTYGTYCPLQYVDPTIEQLVVRRAEYLVWCGALDRVLGTLRGWLLRECVPVRADAPAVPWLDARGGVTPRPAPVSGVAAAWRSWPEPKRKGSKALTR